MFYVRISYMTPRRGQERRVAEILIELSRYYGTCGGYLNGYRLAPRPQDESNRVGRVGVWETEAAAVEAAQNAHALSLRSELLRLVQPNMHEEWSFDGVPDW